MYFPRIAHFGQDGHPGPVVLSAVMVDERFDFEAALTEWLVKENVKEATEKVKIAILK